jgi:uncharacterized repeat protein (TIGR03803 family)
LARYLELTWDGSGFTVLHTFAPNEGTSESSPIVSDTTLFGTTISNGGATGNGTVFALSTDGTGFRILHSFTGNDGRAPYAGLCVSANTLYGNTSGGGTALGLGFCTALVHRAAPSPISLIRATPMGRIPKGTW